MPFYEYRCADCGKKETFFFRSFSEVKDPTCPSCGSPEMSRLLSRSTVIKSTSQRAADTDPARYLGDVNMRDRGSVLRWAHKMADELGDGLGSEFRELAEQAEAGDDALALTLDGDALLRSKLARAAQGDERPLTKLDDTST